MQTETMKGHFPEAFTDTVGREGGLINDPDDPGGVTKYGISQRQYPDLDIPNLSMKDAMAIYHQDYWVKPGLHQVEDKALACRLFDLGVNCGSGTAVKWLQKALYIMGINVAVDGIFGPITAKAVNGYRYPKALLSLVKFCAVEHYLGLNKPKFLAGWLNRLES